jgi:hypothetical protein
MPLHSFRAPLDSMIMSSSQVPTVFGSPLDSMIMTSSHVASHSQSQTLSVFDYDWLSLLCLLVLYLLLLYFLVCSLHQSSRGKKKYVVSKNRWLHRPTIIHYRQLYINRPDPITFMPVAVDTSDRIYDDFLRLLVLHAHREASALTNDIPGGIRPLSFSSHCVPN